MSVIRMCVFTAFDIQKLTWMFSWAANKVLRPLNSRCYWCTTRFFDIKVTVAKFQDSQVLSVVRFCHAKPLFRQSNKRWMPRWRWGMHHFTLARLLFLASPESILFSLAEDEKLRAWQPEHRWDSNLSTVCFWEVLTLSSPVYSESEVCRHLQLRDALFQIRLHLLWGGVRHIL